jgi:DNA mismatch repair protein MutL
MIKTLSQQLISKIAAGEVIERPASVVKELVENSLDAQSSQISIEARGGGINLIKVADNGSGIASDEIATAFQRYATSKIATLADLEGIASLGFRGEALPSIAAVASVEMVSRPAEEPMGTYLRLDKGVVAEKLTKGCAAGTTVTVYRLFSEFPARLKFLKSATTENSHIINLVNQYSLSFPEVRFSLTIDGKRVLHTPGSGKLQDALAEIYGWEVAQNMLEIVSETEMFCLDGYISPPSLNRANRSYMSFFVNQRWISNRLLAQAVEKAYQELLPVGRYPLTAIKLSLPPQEVDVNVHPTKREVRFRNESMIFRMVYQAVRQRLSEQIPPPEIRLALSQPSGEGTSSLLELSTEKVEATSQYQLKLSQESGYLPILRPIGQVATTYIIAEGSDGLYLIDQHAAHERILFEKILAQFKQNKVEIQGLLEPLILELNAKQKLLLESQREMLEQFGFALETFGGNTYLVRSVPAILQRKGTGEALKEIIDWLDKEGIAEEREKKVAASLACHSAIRGGQILTQIEMNELISQLEQADSPYTCPHGRPTMIMLSSGRLKKEFGRS